MACLFAARLAAAGTRVTMLGTWRDGLDALQTRGVNLVDTVGHSHSYTVEATDDPRRCAGAKTALVLVKAWQTQRAAQQLALCLADDGLATTLQNGLGNVEVLYDALGSERVCLGVTTLGATLQGPGRARAGGEGEVALGEHPRVDRLYALLECAGISVRTDRDPERMLWKKLAVNAAINPLTALLRCPNGDLLKRKSALTLLRDAAREVVAVALAAGKGDLAWDPAAAASLVAERTASNRSSMLQDVLRGAPTEIDAICGAVVRQGDRLAVATPVNRALWLLVSALSEEAQNPCES